MSFEVDSGKWQSHPSFGASTASIGWRLPVLGTIALLAATTLQLCERAEVLHYRAMVRPSSPSVRACR